MKKKIFSTLAVCLLATLTFAACGETKSFEAGGLSVVVGENGEFIQGEFGAWEVPGKYKIDVLGAFLDDTGEPVEPILDADGNVEIQPEAYFVLVYDVTNLGYELTEEDAESGEIQKSSMYTTVRINDGEEILLRPYPYGEDDYKHSFKEIKIDYGIPSVAKGETGEFNDQFVTNKPIDIENDVLVFTTFFNDGENSYDGVFEIKFSSLTEVMQ